MEISAKLFHFSKNKACSVMCLGSGDIMEVGNGVEFGETEVIYQGRVPLLMIMLGVPPLWNSERNFCVSIYHYNSLCSENVSIFVF